LFVRDHLFDPPIHVGGRNHRPGRAPIDELSQGGQFQFFSLRRLSKQFKTVLKDGTQTGILSGFNEASRKMVLRV
tara:strand:+ start:1172 stop:1396 length:225 start_codon:yes stop_codon:yes gene_type:complete